MSAPLPLSNKKAPMSTTRTAQAHPNIAVVKYWGKRDVPLNLPAVPSLSVTLDRFRTRTTVTWGIDAAEDAIWLNGQAADGKTRQRVSAFLDLVAPSRPRCKVVSDNNFPTAAGLASSSSAFAALALAADAAAGTGRDLDALSALARQGSGSACRSLWGGWVEWRLGQRTDGTDSHGIPLAPADHWDLAVVVAVVNAGPKKTGSRTGMNRTQETCPFYGAWVATAPADVEEGRAALLDRDLPRLGAVMEQSTLKMHATMLTTTPSIRYWQPASLAAIAVVEDLRQQGVGAWYTMDAGPNVKVLCSRTDAPEVANALKTAVDRVEILEVGGNAILESP